MVLNPHNREETILAELRQAGLKVTPQRRAIVCALAADDTHPTAQDLYERLKDDFPTMSFATVYNTLSALSSIGRVQALALGGAATRFDPNVAPHDHAICEQCGSVRDVLREPPSRRSGPRTAAGRRRETAGAAGTLSDGFQVHRVERMYRGLCAACRDTRSV